MDPETDLWHSAMSNTRLVEVVTARISAPNEEIAPQAYFGLVQFCTRNILIPPADR